MLPAQKPTENYTVPTYDQVRSATEDLLNRFRDTETSPVDPEVLLGEAYALYIKVQSVEGITQYSNRRTEVFVPLDAIRFWCYENFEPTTIEDPKYVVDYLNLLIKSKLSVKGVSPGIFASFSEEQNYFYIEPFAITTINPNVEAGEELLSQVTSGKREFLKPEEIKKLMEYEKNILKIHLNVPPENRVAFIKRLLEEKAKSDAIIHNLRKENGGQITAEEAEKAGATIYGLGTWKFRGLANKNTSDDYGNRLPDFVFYINPKAKDANERCKALSQGLSKIVRDFEDTSGEIPRFSSPVVSNLDGHKHPTLSVTQGNSDTKLWLQRNGQLESYYSPKNNYSTRVD